MVERVEHKKDYVSNNLVFKLLCGILIGAGAALPGVSGGVLCVVFGIYPVVMELISHPFVNLLGKLKSLAPYIVGGAFGFWGISKTLGLLLVKFEAPATCIFIGLVAGMLPSLFVSVGIGRTRVLSYIGLVSSCAVVLGILVFLNDVSFVITPSIPWYVLCGVALAISVIVPGMSFSTLLMPLGLYTPFIRGIGDLNFEILIPAGVGCLITTVAFANLISSLFKNHYSVAQNIVIGVVIAATAAIIPFDSFASFGSAVVNLLCIVGGVGAAVLIDKFNKKYDDKKNSPIRQ